MQPDDRTQLLAVLATGAGDLVTAPDVEESLEDKLVRLTRAAVAAVPGADFAGLTLRHHGRLTSHGPSHEEITDLDRLQAQLGEGPCVDAIVSGTVSMIEVPDFEEAEERWPQFAPEAVRRGVGSLISFAMAPHDAPPGALNLYAREARAFDGSAATIAGAFAMQAAVALYGARRITGLETALVTRDLIGQAKGVLMERHGIDAEAAFERLAAASQHSNLKLVDVARWLVGQTSAPSQQVEQA